MKNQIITSIIANSQKELDERIRKVNSKIFQLDIMDGKFVKNKSLLFDFKAPKGKKYEAHLMIKNPEYWIERNWKKVDSIVFHIEAVKNPDKIIGLIKGKRKKVGIAINPKTKIGKIKIHLDEIDFVIVMTVNPGKYGSKFIPAMLNKVRQIKEIKPNLEIEVDGGVNGKTILLAKKAGANRFVSGSYIQNSENPQKAFEKLKKIANA